MRTGGDGSAVRSIVNRVLAVTMVPVALAHIVVVGWIRPRSAGRVAGRWVRLTGRLTGVTFRVVGRPPGRGPAPAGIMTVLVANHSSPLDIAALLAAEPRTTFVAAAELFRIPLLAGAMRALRTVPVDRRSRTGVQLRLPSGLAGPDLVLAVFPEGGIAPPGERLPFRRSPFALAIEHQAVVAPVAIHGSGRALPPRSRLGVRPATVTVEFLEPIPTAGRTLDDRQDLCQMAERRIGQALKRGAAGGAGGGDARGGAGGGDGGAGRGGVGRRVGGGTPGPEGRAA